MNKIEMNGSGLPRPNGMSMVVIMGVTGSGKSYLINKLAGREVVKEGANLNSCTHECQMIPVNIGNSKVLLIDTPGFDDTKRSDSDILNEIARLLAAQYKLGFELKGIIYVHRITDIRYCGSAVKTFEIFKRICGESALSNVLLTTSRWNEVDEATGASRERQLRDEFWAYMVGRGSVVSRFYGDRTSAIALISQLIVKDAVVLRLQHEMMDEGRQLDETDAGSYVSNNLGEMRNKYLEQLASVEKLRSELQEKDRTMRRQAQLDLERGHEKLRETEKLQVSLRADVAGEVDEEIKAEAKSKSSRLRKILPFVPAALSILGVFVGIPLDVMDTLQAWE
ncbi:P-loop containing nucleoside triphosphate hydrolase protein [Dactylonectria estremocensis]|uniref:P-loop containing nucleoside triphosphate hydrolase protein n=1 Tax=Dactylonectria estremocensis TaxID=1079267 RepID=A0A9P9FG45_9HYPO|nr:P-loop containing nucleoside triphosphate hydrolase protein [Dactylonectria estremocensis]